VNLTAKTWKVAEVHPVHHFQVDICVSRTANERGVRINGTPKTLMVVEVWPLYHFWIESGGGERKSE
jgi:hypothetical protein